MQLVYLVPSVVGRPDRPSSTRNRPGVRRDVIFGLPELVRLVVERKQRRKGKGTISRKEKKEVYEWRVIWPVQVCASCLAYPFGLISSHYYCAVVTCRYSYVGCTYTVLYCICIGANAAPLFIKTSSRSAAMPHILHGTTYYYVVEFEIKRGSRSRQSRMGMGGGRGGRRRRGA